MKKKLTIYVTAANLLFNSTCFSVPTMTVEDFKIECIRQKMTCTSAEEISHWRIADYWGVTATIINLSTIFISVLKNVKEIIDIKNVVVKEYNQQKKMG